MDGNARFDFALDTEWKEDLYGPGRGWEQRLPPWIYERLAALVDAQLADAIERELGAERPQVLRRDAVEKLHEEVRRVFVALVEGTHATFVLVSAEPSSTVITDVLAAMAEVHVPFIVSENALPWSPQKCSERLESLKTRLSADRREGFRSASARRRALITQVTELRMLRQGTEGGLPAPMSDAYATLRRRHLTRAAIELDIYPADPLTELYGDGDFR